MILSVNISDQLKVISYFIIAPCPELECGFTVVMTTQSGIFSSEVLVGPQGLINAFSSAYWRFTEPESAF